MYVCPHCQKQLRKKRSLDAHIAKYHPEHTGGGDTPPAENAEELNLNLPETPPGRYECADCGAEVKKGQEKCPKCGETLLWPEGV